RRPHRHRRGRAHRGPGPPSRPARPRHGAAASPRRPGAALRVRDRGGGPGAQLLHVAAHRRPAHLGLRRGPPGTRSEGGGGLMADSRDVLDTHLADLAAALLPYREVAGLLGRWGSELAWTLGNGGRLLVAGNGGSAAE